MKKSLMTVAVVGTIVFAGVRWTGQEGVNRTQGIIDRMHSIISTMANEMSDMVNHITNLEDENHQGNQNQQRKYDEIRRLEGELKKANQAVETLLINAESRLASAEEMFENRATLERGY